MSVYEDLKANGAEVKSDKKNQWVVGFTSQKVSNNQLLLVNRIVDDVLLAFDGCDFSQCDINLMHSSSIEKIAIFNSNFSDGDLVKLCQSKSLKYLKLFGTGVTSDAVKQIRISKNKIDLYFD